MSQSATVHYRTITVDGVEVFYREAGPATAPTILLLHGFPTSSFMFRNLIADLSGEYHLVAPDYPGFGQSDQPPLDEFDYTFDGIASILEGFTDALGLDSYSLYVMDYGAPVGFRLATAHPERVQALLVQNGNAYEEGLTDFWDEFRPYWETPTAETAEPLRGFITPAGVEWQYTHGVRDESRLSPDTWTLDRAHLDRPGNVDIQLQLFLDYRTNPPLYPKWQAYLREHQPPTLVVWGERDEIFGVEGASPYADDLETVEVYRLDTGHFALEEEGRRIASLIREFMTKHVADRRPMTV
ncbi:alpha/beta fold hydrolase [Haloarchaeobius sp. DFWS5]|uniref:alpha/beta fold hydrolase n=1 Tax=Haloarchaeobius sp. DFWS5 TaxID=3446114 RepID=UPI003EB7B21B